jgi:hypothetical protein
LVGRQLDRPTRGGPTIKAIAAAWRSALLSLGGSDGKVDQRHSGRLRPRAYTCCPAPTCTALPAVVRGAHEMSNEARCRSPGEKCEGAGGHQEILNRALAETRILDWLDHTLS